MTVNWFLHFIPIFCLGVGFVLIMEFLNIYFCIMVVSFCVCVIPVVDDFGGGCYNYYV